MAERIAYLERLLWGGKRDRRVAQGPTLFDAFFDEAAESKEAAIASTVREIRKEAEKRRAGSGKKPARHLGGRNPVVAVGRCDLQQCGILPRSAAFEPLHRLVEAILMEQIGRKCDIGFGARGIGPLQQLLLRIARRLHQRGKRHAHHLPRTAQVIRRHPLPQRALRRRQERCIIENTLYGFDPREVGAPVMHPPDNARIEFVRPELYRHGLTLRDRHPLGNRERIGRLRQRQDYVGIARHQPLLIAWKPLP